MDVSFPECPELPSRLGLAARAWAVSADLVPLSLEVLKLLVTAALIAVTGLLLLMLE